MSHRVYIIIWDLLQNKENFTYYLALSIFGTAKLMLILWGINSFLDDFTYFSLKSFDRTVIYKQYYSSLKRKTWMRVYAIMQLIAAGKSLCRPSQTGVTELLCVWLTALINYNNICSKRSWRRKVLTQWKWKSLKILFESHLWPNWNNYSMSPDTLTI